METIFGGFIWSSWWHIYYWTHKLSSSSCTLFLLYHTLYNSKGALIGVRRMLYWLSMSRMILEVKNVECDLNAKHSLECFSHLMLISFFPCITFWVTFPLHLNIFILVTHPITSCVDLQAGLVLPLNFCITALPHLYDHILLYKPFIFISLYENHCWYWQNCLSSKTISPKEILHKTWSPVYGMQDGINVGDHPISEVCTSLEN